MRQTYSLSNRADRDIRWSGWYTSRKFRGEDVELRLSNVSFKYIGTLHRTV